MSEGMAGKLKEQLSKNRSLISSKDDRGRTLLHQEALAGNVATVQVLLAAGADRNALTSNGMTPLALAQSLGWRKVVEVLK
jgi:ankyrin repeat protein